MQRRASLPSAVTPFVGRADELAGVSELVLRPDVRLVTLCGTAGVGKTRLAVEVGRRVAPSLAGEVRWVPLADVRDPGLVGSALLSALGVGDAGAGDAVARAAEVLGDGPGLLVLDNLEHLLPAAVGVAALLEGCPGLTVLATSRHALGLQAERVVPVGPLRLPEDDADPTGSDAVAFLLSRLEALDPAVPWAADAPVLADIARRVDGLPLALELVAARSRVLSLQAIREGLDHRLDLLGGAGADVPDRQRTMRDALAWSCALLAPPAAVLFRRLGVCVGGADVATAAAVAGDLGLDRPRLLDALDDLVSHHLLVRTPTGRLRMPEVVRELALEELGRAGETAAARDDLAGHALALVESAAGRLAGAEQLACLDELDEASGNLTGSVRYALEQADAILALRLCLGLRFLWYVRGPLVEGQALFAAALALPGAPEDLRAQALVEAAALARHRGELAAADALASQALAIARGLGDSALLGSALLQLGFVLHLMGRYAEAKPLLEECLAIRLPADDRLGTARVLHHLGLVAYGEGDLGRAWELQVRALALFREVDNRRHVATASIVMADVAVARGDLAPARDLLREALDLVVRLQDRPLLSYALFAAAGLAADAGRPSAAVRLLGRAESVARACGAPPWPAVAAGSGRWLPAVTSRYGAPRVSALRTAGAGMTDAEAVSLALGGDGRTEPLTGREREVAELVAEGLTNRAIAARLVVSERTVDGHVASILTKLGFSRRAQVATWVAEQRALA